MNLTVPCPMPVCTWKLQLESDNLVLLGNSYGDYMAHVIYRHPEIVRFLMIKAEEDGTSTEME